MSPTMQPQEEIRSGSPLKVPDGARILIVCDDNNHDTERLKTILPGGRIHVRMGQKHDGGL
jgi:hypothetical protein